MLNKSKMFLSNFVTHKEQGTFSAAIQDKLNSTDDMQEIGKLENRLEQVNGSGASHVPASSDPYAKPYGFYLH